EGNQRPWFGRQLEHRLAFIVEAGLDGVALLVDRQQDGKWEMAIAEHFPDWFRDHRKSDKARYPIHFERGVEQTQYAIPRRHPAQNCSQRRASQWPLVHARRQQLLTIRQSLAALLGVVVVFKHREMLTRIAIIVDP